MGFCGFGMPFSNFDLFFLGKVNYFLFCVCLLSFPLTLFLTLLVSTLEQSLGSHAATKCCIFRICRFLVFSSGFFIVNGRLDSRRGRSIWRKEQRIIFYQTDVDNGFGVHFSRLRDRFGSFFWSHKGFAFMGFPVQNTSVVVGFDVFVLFVSPVGFDAIDKSIIFI
jgi:hypothetical protein